LNLPGKAEFCSHQKQTMKNIIFILLLLTGTVAVSAQTNNAVDTTLKGFPVLKSYVAPDVVFRAKKKFGRALYSIEKSTAANCQNSYLVGLIKNGHLTMEWMCDDPKMVWQIERTSFDLVIATGRNMIIRSAFY
jgi:hypothetical protein